MDARAPAVVAVVVTRNPGPWFEESLGALGAQRYEELAVLVLVAGGDEDPTPRVRDVLPEAFVRRLPEGVGFGAAANEVLGMVEGASYYLVCHDDCAPDPDALGIMVGESYRSNAGIVSPKVVRWDDREVLLHVGMSADRFGAVVDRVQPGEVDHGQHDAVRDVFVAPAGCQLVRADLFAELGGFDPGMSAMGEDLDLSWRAQVMGARVVVAPDAVVRSLEVSAAAMALAAAAPAGPERPPSLQALQRRNELRTVLKCDGWLQLLRVVPVALVLAVSEALAALVARDRDRARAVVAAWRWNLRRAGELRRLRRELQRHRAVRDAQLRRLQMPGSSRLLTYLSRLTHQGFDVAHGRAPSQVEGAMAARAGTADGAVLTGTVGGAFSEDADFDELDDLGRRSGRDRFGRRPPRRILTTRRSQVTAWAVVAVFLIFGTRNLVSGGLPLIGQFLPLPGFAGTWHQFVAGWHPAGVGSTAPATPAFAVLGMAGTLLVGGMGLTEKVLVIGCIPLGAWGVARMLRPMVSARARLFAAVAYLGLALPYDDLARGRWDGLVAYAAVPFVLGRLARATGLPPFGDVPAGAPRRRRTLAGQALTLGVLVAAAAAFAPALVVVVAVCVLGVVAGSVAVGEWRGSLRAVAVGAGSLGVAAVLLGPWVVGTLAGGNAVSVLGLAAAPASSPGWGQLVRFAVGPVGGSPLSWLLVAAALLPLLIGRGLRLGWAARLWAAAGLSWVLALAVSRGATGSFAPSIPVLLAPAAAGVAGAIGLGVGAFESDLSGYRFGWRQVVTGLAALVALAGLLPVAAESFNGRWGLPAAGYADPVAFVSRGAPEGSSRVLWLGDPRALPLGGWSIEPGLAYATTDGGVPDARFLWAPAGPGPAGRLAGAVSTAMAGRTARLGRLLAPAGVRYVVVVTALAPAAGGASAVTDLPPPGAVVPALLGQSDLRQVPTGEGLVIFENASWLPVRASRRGPPVAVGGAPTPADLTGWRAVLPGGPGSRSYSGPVGEGTVLSATAPAGRWRLTVDGRPARRSPAFGWAAQFAVAAPGQARLWFAGSVWLPLALAAQLLVWAAVAGTLLGRGRWLNRRWAPLARRLATRRAGTRGGSERGGP